MKHRHLTAQKEYPGMKMLAVMLLFLASQIAGILHLVEHSIEGDNDGCEICTAIAHTGTATLPEPVALFLPQLQVHEAETICTFQLPAPYIAAYISRAPPMAA